MWNLFYLTLRWRVLGTLAAFILVIAAIFLI